MGIGGSTQQTDGTTLSSFYNPAGLAYVTTPTIGAAVRNLPESNSVVSGRFANPDFNTSRELGSRRVTHLGYATPIRGGTLGISFTNGGYMKDLRSGTGLKDGVLTLNNYVETFQAQTDFFTVAWGKANGSTNFGFGLIIANQYISDVGVYDTFDANNQFSGSTRINNSGNMTGVGAIVGAQFPTSSSGRSVVGVSIRTPISLSKNSSVDSYMNKVPGRASLGMATRSDNLRGGDDFLVYGAQVDYFFGSDKNGLFKRKDVLAGGVGFEYNMHRWGGRVPVRAGFAFSPSGGDSYQSRNSFTFGLGYRPNNDRLSFDLNFAMPTGGGPYDMGLSVGYKLGR